MPRRPGVVEIIDLTTVEQAQLMTEIAQASKVLKAMTGCDKINVAALGNVVPQLHVHVIARWRSDAAWPKPVWGAVPPIAYSESALRSVLADLRERLALEPDLAYCGCFRFSRLTSDSTFSDSAIIMSRI